MDRIRLEEFIRDGKNFLYIDLSDLKTNESFNEVTKIVSQALLKYPPNSLYTITNVANVRFDTDTKESLALYLENNKPYVKYGVVIGVDGIKKIFANTVLQLSGRHNILFAFTKEKAIELLLNKE